MLVTPFGRRKTLLGKYYAAEVDSVEVLAEGEYGVEDNQQRNTKGGLYCNLSGTVATVVMGVVDDAELPRSNAVDGLL